MPKHARLDANARRSIDWGAQIDAPDGVVTVSFVPAGERLLRETTLAWSDYEISRALATLQTYADALDLTFIVVDPGAADSGAVDSGTEADFALGVVSARRVDMAGQMNPPGTKNAGAAIFNRDALGWNDKGGLEAGGYGFATLVHEFGHGLGLAHPHDKGGSSTIMAGVNSSMGDLGRLDLNTAPFTTMSYNDVGRVNGGGLAGPGALDISVLQAKYGANAQFAAGDDVYALSGARGAPFVCIWDAGGEDAIVASPGGDDAWIDLRPAGEVMGFPGGFVSQQASDGGKWDGGFTIAEGAEIENAAGAGGRDRLFGNALANRLDGGAGRDRLFGAAGDDALFGGAGRDRLDGQRGDDRLLGGGGRDRLQGKAGDDALAGGAGRDRLQGGAGDDLLFGGAGADRLRGDAGADRFVFDGPGWGRDRILDMTPGEDLIVLTGSGHVAADLDLIRRDQGWLARFGEEDRVRIALADADATLDESDFLF